MDRDPALTVHDAPSAPPPVPVEDASEISGEPGQAGGFSRFDDLLFRVVAGAFVLLVAVLFILTIQQDGIAGWDLQNVVIILVITGALGLIAWRGFPRKPPGPDPAVLRRFYELADPERPLTDQDMVRSETAQSADPIGRATPRET